MDQFQYRAVNDAPTSVDRLARCIEDLAAWLSASRLRLNPTKTQVLWLGSKYQVDRITVRHVPVLSSSVQVVDSARDLGVVIDSHLTMVDHVTAVCRATYFHLRQLRLITRSLSVDVAKTLVQSFITCHLDYCNALFSGIRQSVQAPTVRAERGSATRHRYSSTWPHHTSVEATPLASGPTTSRFQAGPPGLQGVARCNCRICCRRLPACLSRRPSPSPIGRHRYVLRSTDQHMAWRQPDNDIGKFRRQLKSFLPARRYASAGNSDRNVSVLLSVRLYVCLSVCPSRAGIVSKRRKLAAWFLHHLLAPRL